MVYLVIACALYFLDMTFFPHTQSLAYESVITMVKESLVSTDKTICATVTCISGLWSKVLVKVCDGLRCIPGKKPSSLPVKSSALQNKSSSWWWICATKRHTENCSEQLHHSVTMNEKNPTIMVFYNRHHSLQLHRYKLLLTWSHSTACSCHCANTDLHTWPQQK